MSLNDNWFEYKVIIYRVKQLICSHPNYVIAECFESFHLTTYIISLFLLTNKKVLQNHFI